MENRHAAKFGQAPDVRLKWKLLDRKELAEYRYSLDEMEQAATDMVAEHISELSRDTGNYAKFLKQLADFSVPEHRQGLNIPDTIVRDVQDVQVLSTFKEHAGSRLQALKAAAANLNAALPGTVLFALISSPKGRG